MLSALLFANSIRNPIPGMGGSFSETLQEAGELWNGNRRNNQAQERGRRAKPAQTETAHPYKVSANTLVQ